MAKEPEDHVFTRADGRPIKVLTGQRLGGIGKVARFGYVRQNVHVESIVQEPPMDAISYTAARRQLASTMDKVCEDHAPIIITRNKAQSVVMISLEDYEALQETAYLLRSPKNARRLLESVADLERGGGQERDLME